MKKLTIKWKLEIEALMQLKTQNTGIYPPFFTKKKKCILFKNIKNAIYEKYYTIELAFQITSLRETFDF